MMKCGREMNLTKVTIGGHDQTMFASCLSRTWHTESHVYHVIFNVSSQATLLKCFNDSLHILRPV